MIFPGTLISSTENLNRRTSSQSTVSEIWLNISISTHHISHHKLKYTTKNVKHHGNLSKIENGTTASVFWMEELKWCSGIEHMYSESDRKTFCCNGIVLYNYGDEEDITVLVSKSQIILSDENKNG